MAEPNISKIIRSKRRTVGLEITPDARLVIRAPERTSLAEIHKIVHRKLSWILTKQRLASRRYKAYPKKEFVSQEEFLFLGDKYKLLIVKEGSAPLTFTGKEFLLLENHATRARESFIAWYRQQAASVFNERLKHYADIRGFKYSGLRISSAQRSFGSCSTSNRISLSWRLVMAPLYVVDYVIVHELAHTREKNHSRRFWDKVKAILPGWRVPKKWLKENSHLLRL